jgi:hypothetical protein
MIVTTEEYFENNTYITYRDTPSIIIISLYIQNGLIRLFVEKFRKSVSEPVNIQTLENNIELEFK